MALHCQTSLACQQVLRRTTQDASRVNLTGAQTGSGTDHVLHGSAPDDLLQQDGRQLPLLLILLQGNTQSAVKYRVE